MTVIANWRQVITRAWSMWCVYILIGLHVVDYFGMMIAQYFPLWLAIPVLVLTVASRLIKQPEVSGG